MWKEVFKAGKHTDANGNEHEWSSEDIDAIIAKYNNQLPDKRHEAPVVVGHPVNNSPAYAWVESLKKDGETLLAKFTQIDPEFEQLIKEGRYKKVSIALYPDMMLRHIGFLGAIPPAVKGLKDFQFDEDKTFISLDLGEVAEENLCVSYANAERTQNETYAIKGKERKRKEYIYSPSKFKNFEENNIYQDTHKKNKYFQGVEMQKKYAELFQELLEWIGATFNEEIANQTASELERIKEKVGISNEEFAVKKTESETKESNSVHNSKEFQELQIKLELLENDNREMKFNEYFKSQLGRLVPAQKPIVKLAFDCVRGKDGLEFSENGNSVKLSGEDLIKRLIESFPMQVEFNEIAKQNAKIDTTDLEGQNKFIDEYYKRERQ